MLSSRALFGIVAASLFVYYLIKPKEMGGSLSAQQAYGPPVVMGTEALVSILINYLARHTNLCCFENCQQKDE